MRVLLLADEESKFLWDHFQPEKFQDVEMIISCGDLKAEYLSYLLTVMNVPLFYVPGNHDTNYSHKPPDGCDSLDDGLVKYKNLRILGFGGCQLYNHGQYQYTERNMDKRVRKMKSKLWWNHGLDILVTHAPAMGINDGPDLCHLGFKCFRDILDKYSPKYFFHGHQHMTYGNIPRITKYNNTTIINAFDYYLIDI